MKRIIEIVADDEARTVRLTAKVSTKPGSYEGDLLKTKTDEVDKFVENLTDKFVDALREYFYASTVEIKKP